VTQKVTIAFAAMLAFAASATLAEDTIGVIKRSQGHVVVERGATRILSRPGVELQRGDRLVTGPDGHATLSMRHTASLSVGANSVVPLDRYAAEEKPLAETPAPGILQSLMSFFAVNRQR